MDWINDPDELENEIPEYLTPTPKRVTIWVITRCVNAYDQFGEYFECAFLEKPTAQQLTELGYNGEHLAWGGGRIHIEDEWYHLVEVTEGKKYPFHN